ncbi:MAG: type II toxin-antitoxin system prevent-host-death family antitoxin [Pyrinomonadaceae bacterium]
MPHTVNIDDAKNQFSDLIATAAEGNEVLIVENGKPLARLVPANDSTAYSARPVTPSEFGKDEDLLAWDSEGLENVA